MNISMADLTQAHFWYIFSQKRTQCKLDCVFIDSIPGRSLMELCVTVMVQSIRPLVQWNTLPLPPSVTTVIGCFLSHVAL